MELNEMVSAYLHYRGLHLMKRSVVQQRYLINYFVRYLKAHDLDYLQVNSAVIQHYHRTLLHCTVRTRSGYIAVVRDLYAYIKKQYPTLYPPINPAITVETIRNQSSTRRLPHVPAESTVRKLLSNVKSVRNQLLIELAYGSGLRRCELEALNIEDIDENARHGYVLGKAGKTRIVPITESAVQTLRLYLKQRVTNRGPLFLSNRGTRLKSVTISWICRVKFGIHCHGFRHACATHLLRNGCSTRLIQTLLGHAHLTTTQRYIHIITSDVATVLNRLHPRMLGLIEHKGSEIDTQEAL